MSQVEQQTDDAGATAVLGAGLEKDPLASVDRALAATDLKNPGVVKMLLHRVSQAEGRVERLENYQVLYYDTKRDLAVERTRISAFESVDKTKSSLLAVGSLCIGFIPSVWNKWHWVFLMAVAGVILIYASWHRKLPEGKN
jgi:hypothetical protein